MDVLYDEAKVTGLKRVRSRFYYTHDRQHQFLKEFHWQCRLHQLYQTHQYFTSQTYHEILIKSGDFSLPNGLKEWWDMIKNCKTVNLFPTDVQQHFHSTLEKFYPKENGTTLNLLDLELLRGHKLIGKQ